MEKKREIAKMKMVITRAHYIFRLVVLKIKESYKSDFVNWLGCILLGKGAYR